MKQRRKRESREVWAQRVTAWRASGLSGADFARQHELTHSTLCHWGQVLGRERAEPKHRPSFAEVVVKPSALLPGSSRLEVVLANGRVLRVMGAVDATQLASVVLALESC